MILRGSRGAALASGLREPAWLRCAAPPGLAEGRGLTAARALTPAPDFPPPRGLAEADFLGAGAATDPAALAAAGARPPADPARPAPLGVAQPSSNSLRRSVSGRPGGTDRRGSSGGLAGPDPRPRSGGIDRAGTDRDGIGRDGIDRGSVSSGAAPGYGRVPGRTGGSAVSRPAHAAGPGRSPVSWRRRCGRPTGPVSSGGYKGLTYSFVSSRKSARGGGSAARCGARGADGIGVGIAWSGPSPS
jgi:hypothetical protein